MSLPDSDTVAGVERPDGQVVLEFAGARCRFEGPAMLLDQLQNVPCAVRMPGEAPTGEPLITCGVGPLEAGPGRWGATRERQPIAWAWHDSVGLLHGQNATAELRCNGPAWQASAQIAPNRRGAESLLLALSAASLHWRGGVMLHAASLELGGRVVALIGPSGAGKSTTCRQQRGARLFSVDRLAVAPSSKGWWAFPMPGGSCSAQDLPGSACQRAPLQAILRVRKAASGCTIEDCSSLQSVAALRQSVFHPGLQVEAELELLAHLQRLAREVPVANLQTGLGTLLAEPLGRWLSRRPPAAAEGHHPA